MFRIYNTTTRATMQMLFIDKNEIPEHLQKLPGKVILSAWKTEIKLQKSRGW